MQEDQAEKIAPAKTLISYTTSDGDTHQMQPGDSIVLTYDRATGGFLPLQESVWTQKEILAQLAAGNDIPLTRTGNYCTSIIVQGGRRIKTISMDIDTGNIQSHQAGLQNSTMKRGRAFDENKRKSMEIKE